MRFFSILTGIDYILWAFFGLSLIMLLGITLTIRSKAFQLTRFGRICSMFFHYLRTKDSPSGGVHPLKAFFAGIGGAIGVGNIVGIVTAIKLGGPGALFWTWIAAFFGMIIKYAEVFLGIRYRKPNKEGGYDGGPMYFLQKAFSFKGISAIVSILLCIYGVEIYVFGVIVDTVAYNWEFQRIFVIIALLILVLWGASGGIQRVGNLCSWIIPIFLVLYLLMSLWVIINHITVIPVMVWHVVKYAFTSHAAVGGFIGSGIILTASQGVARGCYSGDIGIGYSSIVHSETREVKPERQASLALFGVFLDTFVVCSLSMFLVLLTDTWNLPIPAALMVQAALEQFFPFMSFFMPLFLFLLGYSTLITYLFVGIKCARYLSPKRGAVIYMVYAVVSLLVCSFFSSDQALLIMSLSGGLLVVFNLIGIFILRKEIHFDLEPITSKKNIDLSLSKVKDL